ncbi:MAG: SRPBCC domain-containing protein [Actinobacteria bacterium]|nr:SRPBCC domain-containing protein [Actinomycetota bacterium]
MTEREPVRREVVVDAPPATAYALFTAHVGAWWPLANHSVFGSGGTVAFEGDELVERSGVRRSVWAEVVRSDPPDGIELRWHPGQDADSATELTVRFVEQGDQTAVRLEHGGWQRLADPDGARAEYDQGWPVVLNTFGRWVQRAPGDSAPDPDWFVLLHQPGPALTEGGSVFEHPDFGEHVAFLNRLRQAGLLVAAGPLPGQPGSGMTVLRATPELDVRRLATEDDLSVARGLLSVQVVPWAVQFTGG